MCITHFHDIIHLSLDHHQNPRLVYTSPPVYILFLFSHPFIGINIRESYIYLPHTPDFASFYTL